MNNFIYEDTAVTQPRHGRRAFVSGFCPIPKKPAINFILDSCPLSSKIKSVRVMLSLKSPKSILLNAV